MPDAQPPSDGPMTTPESGEPPSPRAPEALPPQPPRTRIARTAKLADFEGGGTGTIECRSREPISSFDVGDPQCVGPIPSLPAEFLRDLMIGMTTPFADRLQTLPIGDRDADAVGPTRGLDAEEARLARRQGDHLVGRLPVTLRVLSRALGREDHSPVGWLAGKGHGSRAEPSAAGPGPPNVIDRGAPFPWLSPHAISCREASHRSRRLRMELPGWCPPMRPTRGPQAT